MKLLQLLISKFPSTTITVGGKPYLTRYYLFLKDRSFGNVYVHHFHSSDQGLELHSHPWKWGISIILSKFGYYEERVQNPNVWEDTAPKHVKFLKIERRKVKRCDINLIKSTDFHRVDLENENMGVWTLFFAGPRTNEWGFLNRMTSEYKNWRKNPEAIP